MRLLLSTGIILLAIAATASPLHNWLGPTPKPFFQFVNQRYERWYSEKYFDATKHWTTSEKTYASLALEELSSWGIETESMWTPQLMKAFSVQKAKLDTSWVLVAAKTRTEELQNALEQVLISRNLKTENAEDIYGLGWNFDNHLFAVIYWVRKEPRPKQVPDSKFGFRIVVYKNSKVSDTIWATPFFSGKSLDMAKVPFANYVESGFKLWSEKSGALPPLAFTAPLPLVFLNMTALGVARAHLDEFGFPVRGILYRSPDEVMVFYP